MVRPAPRRPAWLPALVFLAASWLASEFEPGPALALPLGAALVFLALDRCTRRIDILLAAAAWTLGLLHGATLVLDHDDARGRAALQVPLDAPIERSWIGVLRQSPKRIDGDAWALRLDARLEHAGGSDATLQLSLEVPATGEMFRRRLEALRAGARVRVWARSRIPPPARRTRDLIVRGRVKSTLLIEPLGNSRNALRDIVQRRRDRLGRRLWTLYGDDERLAGFLSAVLLGERSFRDRTTEARLRAAGLAHVLAISGLHVGVVAAGFLWLVRRFSRAQRPAAAAMLLGFGVLVGWAVPVRRSVGSALLLLGGRSLGREGDPLNRLACLALLLPWFLPGGIDDASFALSFTATAGILLSLPTARRRRSSAGARVCAGAYLATAPLCAAYFGQLAPWAPLANLLALPFIALLLVAGYASLFLGGLVFVGPLSCAATRMAFAAIDGIAAGIDRLPASPWYVAAPAPQLLVALAAAGLCTALGPAKFVRRLGGTVFGLGIVLVHLGPIPESTDLPHVELFDVGQGQALLWNHDGRSALIDTGGRTYGRWDPTAAVVRPAILRRGLRRIEHLVLSHAHADHAGGAPAVLEAFEVGELWLGPGWWRDSRMSDIAALARERGVAVRLVWRGAGTRGMRVVSPSRDGPDPSNNAGSLALVLGVAPWTVFVPGDLDGRGLERALDGAWVEPVGALVLAHHGSRRGTPERLLERLRPRIALASCGRNNRFGHPHPATLKRLGAHRIPLSRTDHVGTIRLGAHGSGWVERVNPRTSPGTR